MRDSEHKNQCVFPLLYSCQVCLTVLVNLTQCLLQKLQQCARKQLSASSYVCVRMCGKI